MQLRTGKFNDKLVRNNRFFLGIFAFFQILFMFQYGFFGSCPSYVSETQNKVHGLFIACGVAALVLISNTSLHLGFGLVLGYMKLVLFKNRFHPSHHRNDLPMVLFSQCLLVQVKNPTKFSIFRCTDDFPLGLTETSDFHKLLIQPLLMAQQQ
jgi:hypothetical protein